MCRLLVVFLCTGFINVKMNKNDSF